MPTRRKFLQAAGVGGAAGLAAVATGTFVQRKRPRPAQAQIAPTTQPVPPPPGPVQKSLDNPGPGMRAPGFYVGTVELRDGDLIYMATAEGAKVVRTTNASLIWRGGPVPADSIQKGDVLHVSGALLPDGTIAAVNVEANVGQVRGTIAQILSDGWQVIESKGTTRRVIIDTARPPEVLRRSAPADVAALRQVARNSPVMIIGLVLPDGSLRATKVFLA